MGSNVSGAPGATDTVIEGLILSVSGWIDQYCRRPDGFEAVTTATAREYVGRSKSWALIDECVQVTLVEVRHRDETAWTALASGDWMAFAGHPSAPKPNLGRFEGLMLRPRAAWRNFPDGGDGEDGVATTVRVTARWGYADSVPDAIKQACTIQVVREFKRGQSAFNDAVGNGEQGMMQYLGADPLVTSILKQGRFVRPMV
jgi:hypothetical protein